MATPHPRTLPAAALREGAAAAAHRRWCMLAIALALLLGLYAGGVAWLTQQVEAGVNRSLQPLPALARDRPAG